MLWKKLLMGSQESKFLGRAGAIQNHYDFIFIENPPYLHN